MNTQNKHVTVVVEGIGDVVQKYYAPTLKNQHDILGDNLTVIFVDESEHWNFPDNPEYVEEIERNKTFLINLEDWGAQYIDKSDRESDKGYSKYKTLKADIVFIATPDFTHIKLASFWLSEEDKCKAVFIEKPIDSDLSRAQMLQYYSLSNPKVQAIDHYLPRFGRFNDKLSMKGLIGLIGGKIEKINFYLLEDRSKAFKGPIEAELRKNALQKGLVLDLFPHILALLNHVGRVETTIINSVKVARYSYDSDENGNLTETTTTKETFAQINFSLLDFAADVIEVDAYIGKGIGGSVANSLLDLPLKGEVKLLEFLGKNNRKCVFDLRNTKSGGKGKVGVIDEKGTFITKDGSLDLSSMSLLPEPYSYLIGQIIQFHFENLHEDPNFLLTPITAKNFLTIIHEILSLIELFEKTNTKIPLYHIKTKKMGDQFISQAPMLEDDFFVELEDIRKIIKMQKIADYYETVQ